MEFAVKDSAALHYFFLVGGLAVAVAVALVDVRKKRGAISAAPAHGFFNGDCDCDRSSDHGVIAHPDESHHLHMGRYGG